jgi:hypothetical protein
MRGHSAIIIAAAAIIAPRAPSSLHWFDAIVE